jgi:hypothetical protein
MGACLAALPWWAWGVLALGTIVLVLLAVLGALALSMVFRGAWVR